MTQTHVYQYMSHHWQMWAQSHDIGVFEFVSWSDGCYIVCIKKVTNGHDRFQLEFFFSSQRGICEACRRSWNLGCVDGCFSSLLVFHPCLKWPFHRHYNNDTVVIFLGEMKPWFLPLWHDSSLLFPARSSMSVVSLFCNEQLSEKTCQHWWQGIIKLRGVCFWWIREFGTGLQQFCFHVYLLAGPSSLSLLVHCCILSVWISGMVWNHDNSHIETRRHGATWTFKCIKCPVRS